MATAAGKDPEVLLVLMSWDPPADFIDSVKSNCPGIEIITHKTGYYDKGIPSDVSQDVWNRVTVLFTWNSFPAPEQAPRLRYVQLLSAGCNQLSDKPIFTDTDVAFCTANGVHPPQIAEWVIATYLGFQHHLYEHWENQKKQSWVLPESDEDTEDAVGQRMGILGYGCIGRQCARLASALGMDVHAFTLHERPTPESRQDNDSYVVPGLGDPSGSIPSRWFHGDQLNQFLEGLDFLVITLPLTESTRRMIARDQFQAMSRKKTFLCNIARGPVVDTDELMKALNEETIRGAALDVTDPEPLPADHVLWKAKNVVITPHVSGNSMHYNERVLQILATNLKRRAEGKKIINEVNKKLGY